MAIAPEGNQFAYLLNLVTKTPSTDATSIEKKSKKDKKKKSKSSPAEIESVPMETEQVVSATDDSKSSKKKSKKRKHAEVETETVPEQNDEMQLDAEPGKAFFRTLAITYSYCMPALNVSEKKKKKKKYLHEEQKDVVDAESSSDKKEKKKKKKDRKKMEDTAMDIDAAIEPKKIEKKQKDKISTKEVPQATSPTSASASTPAEVSAFLTQNNITIHAPSSSSPVIPFLNFAQLPIPDPLRTFSAKFKEPSPVQACTWPPALEGKDVVGIAETGSGKTLAFGIPALARLISSPPPPPSKSSPTITTLVLAPTRELALQTHEALENLGEQFGIASVAVFGGVPKEGQVKMLRNLHKANSTLITRIIVGTPGRILDLMSEGACDLSGSVSFFPSC